MKVKPRLKFGRILSMCVGFLGIQMGFALQNGNMSRILEIYGAELENLSLFWLIAPLVGLIIQPIVGHYSDHTWTKFGRRRPYFLVGALVASVALFFMPNGGLFAAAIPPIFIGAGCFVLMDAGFNITQEPFRAMIADTLPNEQSTTGFSVQTLFIGMGAVIGSFLPYILSEWFHVTGETSANVPNNVLYSFYIGSAMLVLTILWSITHSREYTPEEMAEFATGDIKAEKPKFSDIFYALGHMPKKMKQLGAVQFFSWIAFFGIWVYTTPAVAQHIFEAEAGSAEFKEAGDWVGLMFSVYNFVSMLVALTLIPISKKLGRTTTHSLALIIGGLSLISMFFVTDKMMMILPMIGLGIAWASVITLPYAMLAPALPADKVGVFMGIFNFFITIPQIVNALLSGTVLKYCFGMDSIWMIVLSGAFMIIGAIVTTFIKDKQ